MQDLFGLDEEAKPFCPDPKLAACDFGILTTDTLPAFIDECIEAGKFALDTETTGLDKRVYQGRTQDIIVGISLSPGKNRARYIPIRHRGEAARHNLPWSLVLRELKRLEAAMQAHRLICYNFNAGYDHEMISNTGDQDPFNPWDDIQTWKDGIILAYLADSSRKTLGLKGLVKSELGITMLELGDLFPDSSPSRDFSTLDPSRPEVAYYACSDAICHFWIVEHFEPMARDPYLYREVDGKRTRVGNPDPNKSQQTVIKIEQLCMNATRWMIRNRVPIDRAKAKALIELGQREWYEAVRDFYAEAQAILGRDVRPPVFRHLLSNEFVPDANKTIDERLVELATIARFLVKPLTNSDPDAPPGRTYEVTSPAQLGDLLTELGVPGLRETEKGTQVDTSAEEIDRIAEECGEQFPFVLKISRARSAQLAMTNWLIPFYQETDPRDDTAAFPFKQLGTETGRFSSPKDKKLSTRKDPAVPTGWPGSNFQSLSGPRKGRPECMNRARECIRARNKKVIVSVDFSGVELRIVTNRSGEAKWVEAFFLCDSCKFEFPRGDGESTPEPPPPRCPRCGSDRIGDLHATTAISVLNAKQTDSDWKDKRSMGKVLNFAMVYGGGGDAASRSMGTTDKNEGWRVHKKFNDSYQGLKEWWTEIIREAEQDAGVFSSFGRYIPTREILEKQNRFLKSIGERNAKNAPIQATSADITKLSMGLIYKKFKDLGWLDRARLLACMHDELVFEVELEILEEMIGIVRNLMTRNPLLMKLKWCVPLTCDVEIGFDWTVPWNLWEMLYGEVRFHGNKKYKKAEDAARDGHDWNQLERFPEALRPYFKVQTVPDGSKPEPKPEPSPTGPLPDRVKIQAGWILKVPARTELFADRIATLLHLCRGSDPVLIEAGGKVLESQRFTIDPVLAEREAARLGIGIERYT